MTKRRSTKGALLMSVLSLFLCFSMLLGTTFAWFTDEVTSDKNVIKSGNLDVNLYHTVNGANEEVDGNTKLFNDVTLWEPGAMVWEKFTVANEGNLALKYQFTLNALNATVIGGVSFASMLKVAIVDGSFEYTRQKVEAIPADKWQSLETFTLPGELEDGEKDIYGIIIWWQPTNDDNRFNTKENVSVEVSVNLIATQVPAADEFDGFGTDYDEDAWVEGWQVYNAQDLQAAINNGKTNITLEDDIVLDEPIVIPAAPTTYSLRNATPAVEINLNGKNITANNTKAAGAIIINNGNAIINGEDSVISNGEVNGAALIINNGMLVINGGSYVGAPTDTTTGTASYAVQSVGKDATLVINNASVIGRGAIAATGGAKVEINGGTYHTPAIAWGHAVYATDENTEVVINGGTFSEGYEMSANNWGMYQIYSGNKAHVTVNGGNFLAWDCANGYDLCTAGEGTIAIFGGTFADDPANQNKINYVADGFKAVQNADGTYTVAFPQESFDELINNAQPGDTVKVPAGEYTFPASKLQDGVTLECAPGTVFTGTSSLNVNGATVVGATFSNPTGTAVSQTINGTFKNCVFTGSNGLRWCYSGDTVVFEDCVFDGDVYGVHFDGGAKEVIFKNCTISGFNATAGSIEKVTFDGCTFKANGKSNYNGINSWGSTDYINCTFVFDGTAGNEWVHLRGEGETMTFTNCVVEGNGQLTDYIEKTETGVVIIDGKKFVVAETLSAVMAAAKEGNVIIDARGANLGDFYYNGTFGNGTVLKNAKFTYVYGASVNGVATFENCEFVSNHSYSANFSDGSYTGKVIFNNCYFDGWSSFGDVITGVEMNNCTFDYNNPYSVLRFYQNAVLNNCNFIDIEGIDTNKTGTVVEFNNCTGIEGKIYNNGSYDGTWIVDGVDISDTVTAW